MYVARKKVFPFKLKLSLITLIVVVVTVLYVTNLLSTLNCSPKVYHEGPKIKKAVKKTYKNGSSNTPLYCYSMPMDTLDDISELNPPKDKSIFFLETTCRSFETKKLFIDKRQACAVESAAKMNPNRNVYLLFSSPGQLKSEGNESDRLLNALMGYSNIKLARLNYEDYIKDTPVENITTSLKTSVYVKEHTSDMLRLVTLWKYGGIYMDLDVLVLKSLENLKLNFGGAEELKSVANGVLSFDATSKGHDYVQNCLEMLAQTYRPRVWAYNGPFLITRMLQKLCEGKKTEEIFQGGCKGFAVYPVYYFYPIHYTQWFFYFQEQHAEKVFLATKNSYLIHSWNHISKNFKMPLNSKAAYITFARKFCPKVLEQCDEYM